MSPQIYQVEFFCFWDLVYPWQNHDVREIWRNVIGCLEDWQLEKLIYHGKS